VRVYLVRHGRPAGTFSNSADAGLDPAGHAQAEAMAEVLGPLGPLAIVTSPMLRTRETAAPLERRWARAARVETAVSEIPSPGLNVAERGPWLRAVMKQRWPEVDPWLVDWRDRVLATLVALPESTVVTSHFVAINVAVGAATGDDRVIAFAPDHCSVSVFEVEGGRLRLIERGLEAETVPM
jgi:broad specificity phosphatase PhoE